MTKKKLPKAGISQRALAQRIQRALAKKGEQLRGTRGRSGGAYSRIAHGGVVAADVDLAKLGRELGVLADWETLS